MSDETEGMSVTALKSFFGVASIMKVLRHELNLTPNEQFLSLCYAMVAITTDCKGMTDEQAIELVKMVFAKNKENAKAGFESSKKGKRGGAK